MPEADDDREKSGRSPNRLAERLRACPITNTVSSFMRTVTLYSTRYTNRERSRPCLGYTAVNPAALRWFRRSIIPYHRPRFVQVTARHGAASTVPFDGD